MSTQNDLSFSLIVRSNKKSKYFYDSVNFNIDNLFLWYYLNIKMSNIINPNFIFE
jgi:hypothetical protein